MASVQKADPVARRRAMLLVVVGVFAGSVLIVGFERCRAPLLEWLLSKPGESGHQLRLLFACAAVLASAPLIAFAVYLWSLGARVIRAQRFPLPEQRVIRDTPILEGQAAIARGRGLKVVAVSLCVAAVVLCSMFWGLALMLSRSAT
jgi:hypothetical protein